MEKFYELHQRGNNNYGHDHDDRNHGAGSDIGSHRIGELTEDWWQWAVQLPTGANPFEDKTGQYAAMGDVGRVFYVAGIGGSDADPRAEVATAERSFEVPANSLLLIPTLNWSDSLPENPLLTNKQDLTESIATLKSFVTSVFFEIDGKVLFDGPGTKAAEKHYVESGFFSLGTITDDTVGANIFGLDVGVEHTPAKAGGYWVALHNLSAGEHEIRFGGSFDFDGIPGDDFSIEAINHINVVASPKHYWPHGHSDHALL